jgi:nitrogen-specific signal transduction histidine kinase
MKELVKRVEHEVDLESVLDNLPSAIIVVDKARRVLLANKMAEAFANRSKHEMISLYGGEAFGCIHSEAVPEGCGFAPPCEFCLVKNTVLETFEKRDNRSGIETTMTFSNTGKRCLRFSTTYLPLKTMDAVILAMEDITETRVQEMLRLENEKLVAAIQTGGAVCHEINQPLMAISGYVDLMLLDIRESDSTFQKLKVIKGQVERLAGITRKLSAIQSFRTKEYLNQSRILDLEKSLGESA